VNPIYRWLDSVWHDLVFGVRSLGKNPILTCVVVLTLTVGIGVNAGVFALFNAAEFRPWVQKDKATFIRLYAFNLEPSFHFGQPGAISLPDYRAFSNANSLHQLSA
jgi:hypothetical protein